MIWLLLATNINVIRQVDFVIAVSSNNHISRMASRSIPRILEYFELPDDLADNFRARCRYCRKEISVCMRSTSNFIKHIKRNHLLKYQEFKDHNGTSE